MLFIPILILLGVNAFVIVDRQGDEDVSASPGTTTTLVDTTTTSPSTTTTGVTTTTTGVTTTTSGVTTTTTAGVTTTTTAGGTQGHPNTGGAAGLAPGIALIGAGLALAQVVRRQN